MSPSSNRLLISRRKCALPSHPALLTLAVAEGYKTKSATYKVDDPVQTTATGPVRDNSKSKLKRSLSEEEVETENSVPKLVAVSSFNSFTSDDDWEEPGWLLPKEVVCADVEMREAS